MTVNEYMKLPYAVEISWDSSDEIFVARVAEIPECSGHGPSRNEAMEMALENLRDWIEDAIATGGRIPQPVPVEELPSGKWVQRVPRRLHAELTALAAGEHVSLNQLVVSMLSRAIGYQSGMRDAASGSIQASLEPSTFLWREISDDVAISRAWKIHQCEENESPDPSFLKHLASQLPSEFKMTDRNPEEYAKQSDHKIWN